MKATIHQFKVKALEKPLILFFFLFIGLFTLSCRQETGKNNTSQEAVDNLSVKTVTMPVEGMSCGSCVSTVKRTVKALDGVQQVEVSLEKREAIITYADEKISPEQIGKAITEKGYKTGKPVEVKKQ